MRIGGRVDGRGCDYFGAYSILGSYDHIKRRIEFGKRYENGTYIQYTGRATSPVLEQQPGAASAADKSSSTELCGEWVVSNGFDSGTWTLSCIESDPDHLRAVCNQITGLNDP